MIKDWKPTPGLCYYDSYQLITRDPAFKGAVLVHGYPRLTRPSCGRPAGWVYGHAWLEMDHRPGGRVNVDRVVLCHDHLHLDNPVPMDLYYKIGRIEEIHVQRYTVEEAMVMAVRWQHYGPWHNGPTKE